MDITAPSRLVVAERLAACTGGLASPRTRADAILAELAAASALAAPVPAAMGGPGADLITVMRLCHDVGRQSGSAGLILAMHTAQLYSLIHHCGTSDALRDAVAGIVRGQTLIASVASEVGAGGDIFGGSATFADDGDRLTVTKATPNVSYARQAGHFLLTARDTSGSRPVQRALLIAAADATLTNVRETTMMGMRGIDNIACTLCASAARGALLADPFPSVARQTMVPATHLLWAAVWSGIAAGALARAKAFVKKEMKPDAPDRAAAEVALSEAANKLHVLAALARDGARDWTPGAPAKLDYAQGARINRLKIEASDLVVDVTLRAMRICGLRGYVEGGPYGQAEAVADALSAPLMVGNARLQRNTAALEPFINETL